MKKIASLFVFMIALGGIIIFGNIVIVAQQGNQQQDMAIDAAMRSQVIESLLKDLNESYVFPDTAKKMESDVRNRLKSKEYDRITSGREFAQKLTDDLQSVSKDKHLRVRYSY